MVVQKEREGSLWSGAAGYAAIVRQGSMPMPDDEPGDATGGGT